MKFKNIEILGIHPSLLLKSGLAPCIHVLAREYGHANGIDTIHSCNMHRKLVWWSGGFPVVVAVITLAVFGVAYFAIGPVDLLTAHLAILPGVVWGLLLFFVLPLRVFVAVDLLPFTFAINEILDVFGNDRNKIAFAQSRERLRAIVSEHLVFLAGSVIATAGTELSNQFADRFKRLYNASEFLDLVEPDGYGPFYKIAHDMRRRSALEKGLPYPVITATTTPVEPPGKD